MRAFDIVNRAVRVPVAASESAVPGNRVFHENRETPRLWPLAGREQQAEAEPGAERPIRRRSMLPDKPLHDPKG
jgi:hypothetical protein